MNGAATVAYNADAAHGMPHFNSEQRHQICHRRVNRISLESFHAHIARYQREA